MPRSSTFLSLETNLSILFISDRLLKPLSAMLAHFLEAVDIDVQVENELYTASKTINTRA